MKKTILYFLSISSLALLTLSCEDFLDKQPHASVSDDMALTTLADCETALNGVYSALRGQYIPNGLSVFDILSDNLIPLGNWRQSYLAQSRFNYDAGNAIVESFWTNAYVAIARANNILEVIDSKEGEQDVKDRIKGSCLLARAWAHFDLVRLYAKPYNATTASSERGVPYVKKTTLDKKARNTMREVYDFLIADLREVVDNQLLKGTNINYFTDAAARLLLSRAYLYTGEDQEVIREYTEFQALYAAVHDIETTPTTYQTIWTIDANNKEVIYKMPLANNEFSQARALGDFWIADSQPGGARPEFMPTKNGSTGLYDLYEADDIRLTYFYRLYTTQQDGPQYLVNKYPGNTTLTASHRTNAAKIFRYAELLLNYAEASARRGNLEDARTVVNKIRSAREANIYGVSFADRNDALDKIFLERRLEFCFEGHYFHDLKRYNKGFSRVWQPGAFLPVPEITVSSSDIHWVWPIPTAEINANPGIGQNDGY